MKNIVDVIQSIDVGPCEIKNCDVYINHKYYGHAKLLSLWISEDEISMLTRMGNAIFKECLFDTNKRVVWLNGVITD